MICSPLDPEWVSLDLRLVAFRPHLVYARRSSRHRTSRHVPPPSSSSSSCSFSLYIPREHPAVPRWHPNRPQVTPQQTLRHPQGTPRPSQGTPRHPQGTPRPPQEAPRHPQETPQHPRSSLCNSSSISKAIIRPLVGYCACAVRSTRCVRATRPTSLSNHSSQPSSLWGGQRPPPCPSPLQRESTIVHHEIFTFE